MDDIKLLAKMETVETQIQAVGIYSQYIAMEFGLEKCAMLLMKRGKRHIMEGIELLNQEKYQTVRRKWSLQILGNIESGHHKTNEDKGKKNKQE